MLVGILLYYFRLWDFWFSKILQKVLWKRIRNVSANAFQEVIVWYFLLKTRKIKRWKFVQKLQNLSMRKNSTIQAAAKKFIFTQVCKKFREIHNRFSVTKSDSRIFGRIYGKIHKNLNANFRAENKFCQK